VYISSRTIAIGRKPHVSLAMIQVNQTNWLRIRGPYAHQTLWPDSHVVQRVITEASQGR